MVVIVCFESCVVFCDVMHVLQENFAREDVNPCYLFQREFLSKTTNFYVKLSGLGNGFVIGTDKRQIVAAQFESQRAALARFETDLRKSSQPSVRWRDRSNQIADVNQNRFLAGALARCLLP